MNDEDSELERLKAKRLTEMQKNLLSKKEQESQKSNEQSKNIMPSSREILVKRLGYRGLEVLENAELQYPTETKIIVTKIAELLSSGEINEEIDGGKLLLLFRSIGLNIRMKTTINVEQDGKFVSLSDKLSNKIDSESHDES